jgi:hypothetical protein
MGVVLTVGLYAQTAMAETVKQRVPRAELQGMLADIKCDGYATSTKTRRLVDEVSPGTPVNSHDRVFASVTVRFIASAVPLKTALERQCAANIGTLYSEQQSAAHATGAPETAA